MLKTFEDFVLEYTGRDMAYHLLYETTGLEFARLCWNEGHKVAQQEQIVENQKYLPNV